MFEYKDAQFYNAYCEQLDDFVLLEYFQEEGEYYIGKLLACHTIHRLELEVKIPKTFPHNKLYFYTSSLYGYPHLIPSAGGNSWFCLNAAFAETALDQLDEEFDRLRIWIKEQMRPELPPVISDRDTSRALSLFNTYSRGNQDEMDELHCASGQLVFVGDYAKSVESLRKRRGVFKCVKQENGTHVVSNSLKGTNEKLPYIVVDHTPKNLQSFAALTEEFGWDNDLCERLLPGFHWGKIESEGKFDYVNFLHMNPTLEELERDRQWLSGELETMNVPKDYRLLMEQKLKSFVDRQKRFFDSFHSHNSLIVNNFEMDPQDAMENYFWSHHYFALGVINGDRIEWCMLSAQRISGTFESQSFDFGKIRYETKRVVDIQLFCSKSKRVDYENFFGRGGLSSRLVDKKILLVGTGAIGSFLAETLVRGGIRNITLADGDLVEAGNLCRASFELNAIGNSKADALQERLRNISPFCRVRALGDWDDYGNYKGGELYGNINYDGQEKFLKELNQYDLILDCTASNELLHFLSYAVKDTVQLISVCITNHAQDCLFISNADGNVFEQRKHLLAKIEQDTDNFYTEGTGCYAPTFFATASDMLPFTNLVVRKINKSLASNKPVTSTIWSYKDDAIVADSLYTYIIEEGAIRLIVPQSVLDKIRQSTVFEDGNIGILMGGYASDGTMIFVTHIVGLTQLQDEMKKVKEVSEGILDYVGQACLSGLQEKNESILREIASDEGVNTNNPLLAQLNPDGEVAFSLLINGELIPFKLQN